MKILLLTSEKDMASVVFKDILLNNYDFLKKKDDFYYLNNFTKDKELKLVQNNKTKNQIFLKNIKNLHLFFDDSMLGDVYDVVVVLSKHSTLSKNKNKCFTAHALGNFDKAEFGGKDKTLVKTDAFLIRYLLLNLKKNKPKNLKEYEIKQEATHHGPFISTKILFFEIGSNVCDWLNKDAVFYMSKILINSLLNYSPKNLKNEFGWESVCGFGGSHYCTVFNRYTFDLKNRYCFGHVVPSYSINNFIKNKLFKEIKEKGFSKKILKENLEEL